MLFLEDNVVNAKDIIIFGVVMVNAHSVRNDFTLNFREA